LTALAYNQSHRNENVKLFEIGSVFALPSEGSGLPDEHEMLGVILGDNDAFVAKQLWDVIAAGLGINGELRNATDLPGLHPRRAGQIIVEGQEIGVLGELDPRVLENCGVANRCGWLELRLDRLIQSMSQNATRRYDSVSTYPSSDLDLAFVVKDEIQASDVERTIRSLVGSELASLELFDVFRGEKLGEGNRSLAFSLRFQSAEGTLSHDQLASLQERCIQAVETTHDARLR
jgi:phenylalanyl-tRNA synthetase beta chain